MTLQFICSLYSGIPVLRSTCQIKKLALIFLIYCIKHYLEQQPKIRVVIFNSQFVIGKISSIFNSKVYFLWNYINYVYVEQIESAWLNRLGKLAQNQ